MNNKITLNEISALFFVLSYITVDQLLTSAMNGFSTENTAQSKDNEKICFNALHSFLN